MWELGFEVVELARASGHGRAQGRREERVRCEQSVVVMRDERQAAQGWALDLSTNGARLFVSAGSDFAIGELVRVYLRGELFVGRVVWGYSEEDAWVIGIEREEDEIEVTWAA